MAIRWAVQNGNWSSLSTWNDSGSLGFPTASDDIWANNFTVNVDTSFQALSLNSTARARDIATPAMTANNVPSPYVAAASSENNPTTAAAFNAFNRGYGTGTGWRTSAANTGWLSMDFGSGSSIVIDGYTIYGTDSQGANPRNWTLESSNDNTNWTIRHTVSGAAAIGQNSTYSVASVGNTTGSRYYRINVSLNGGGVNLGITELELYERSTAALSAGGSFNFNSGSISGSATSTSPLSAGATNLITVTAPSGTVGLTLGGALSFGNGYGIISHTGNCNFNLTGVSYTIANPGVAAHALINKSSAGTMTIQGTLLGGTGAGAGVNVLSSTNGNTIILGNVLGATRGTGTIVQTAGNLIISGSVTGGTVASLLGISFSGTSISVVGDVAGRTGEAINTTGPVFVTGNVTGSVAAGIITTAPVVVTGSVLSQGAAAGISSTSAIFINVSGSVISSATANAINATNASAVVNLAGNMVNTSGKTAIYCQNLFLSNTDTTTAQFFTVGSQDRTLYSADTFPNLPSASNVRFGTTYGPGSGNTGTLRMASPQDVRSGVLTDNTTGSAILTAQSLFNEISSSTDPFAQRLRNISTVDTTGYLLTAFKK